MMTSKQVVQKYFETAYMRRNLKEAQALLADTYVLHDPALPDFRGGPAGWRAAQERYQGSISDWIVEEFQNWDTQGLLRQLAGPFRPVTPPPRFGPLLHHHA